MKIPWSKIKDALLVAILSLFCPMFLQLFRFPIEAQHIIGCGLLGLVAAIYILVKSPEPEEKIEKRKVILHDVDDTFMDKINKMSKNR